MHFQFFSPEIYLVYIFARIRTCSNNDARIKLRKVGLLLKNRIEQSKTVIANKNFSKATCRRKTGRNARKGEISRKVQRPILNVNQSSFGFVQVGIHEIFVFFLSANKLPLTSSFVSSSERKEHRSNPAVLLCTTVYMHK